MGLIWNSKSTQDMINRLAFEFSGDSTLTSTAPNGSRYSPPIGRWREIAQDGDFTTKTLSDIAKDEHIFGDDKFNSEADKKWQKWLTHLGTGNHRKLRDQIGNALLSKTIDEIVFAVVPRKNGNAVKIEDVEETEYHSGLRALVITVRTPTADAVRLFAQRKARARRAAKSATGKSATRKKKA